MSRACLSLGSNLGDRLAQLAEAVQRLTAEPGVKQLAVSGIYETLPQGKTDQPDFLNCAILLETSLAPLDLLAAIHRVERAMGRVRTERWGPRTIDIDILLYDDQTVAAEGLEVPHPRMGERAFVLIPLLELLPERTDLKRLLQVLPDQGVRPYLATTSFRQRLQGVE